MEDDRRFSYFFLGLGIGVAAGLLLAPKSGAETREFLLEKADEGKEFLKRKSGELRDQAGGALDKSREAWRRQKESLTAAVEAGKQAYREKVEVPGAAGDTEASRLGEVEGV